MKVLVSILAIIFLFSSPAQAKINFQEPKIPIPRDLKKASLQFRLFINVKLKAETCSEQLQDIYESIYALSPEHFLGADVLNKNLTELMNPAAGNPLKVFFHSRLALRNKFTKWVRNNEFASYGDLVECGKKMKVALRTLRTFEDYYGQVILSQSDFFKSGQHLKKFEDNLWPHTMIRPLYMNSYRFPLTSAVTQGHSLESGDILLSRGRAFSGAAISRIGNIDNQFSHLALVYIADGQIKQFLNRDKEWQDFIPGQVYILEAVLDNGLQVVTLDKYLEERKARIAHYRYTGNGNQKNLQSIRKKAADLLAAKAATGEITYNFSMDMFSSRALFCSQAISYAYKMACEESQSNCQELNYQNPHHTYPFPLITTEFPKKDGKFINPLAEMLGVVNTNVFSPADVDLDPQLELIAEWRDFSIIEGRRIHDMVLTKVFQWMEQGGYHFDESPFVNELSSVGKLLAAGFQKMPPNTPVSYVKGTVLLGYLVESPGLNPFVVKLATKLVNKWGTDLTPKNAKRLATLLQKAMDADLHETALVQNYTDKDLVDFLTSFNSLFQSEKIEKILTYMGLNKQVESFAKNYQETLGYPPTDYVYDWAIEELRISWCKDYKSGVKARFHDFFAPKFEIPSESCSEQAFDWKTPW